MITDKMIEAAKAVLTQWDTPDWKLTEPTAKLMEELRKAVNEAALSTDQEPVAEIVSAHGDPEAFGERELVARTDIQKFPYGTKLYSALSAQVQDESEIIDCLLGGEPFVFDPATHFCHADDGGAPEHGIKYVPAHQVHGVTVPEGWKMVPMEPTHSMMKAGQDWRNARALFDLNDAFHVYRAMLSASPNPEESK